MRAVRARDNKADVLLRSELWRRGHRYRKYANLPGHPDITFRCAKTAVFVDGDFWHGRVLIEKGRGSIVQSFARTQNRDWWIDKITATVDRDDRINHLLKHTGWRVLRLWERDILADIDGSADLGLPRPSKRHQTPVANAAPIQVHPGRLGTIALRRYELSEELPVPARQQPTCKRLQENDEDAYEYIKAYWKGVAEACSEAWDADPKGPVKFRIKELVAIAALAKLGNTLTEQAIIRGNHGPAIRRFVLSKVARLDAVDWTKDEANPWMRAQAGFAGQIPLYETLRDWVLMSRAPRA